jgi:hypothetical protein
LTTIMVSIINAPVHTAISTLPMNKSERRIKYEMVF